MVFEELEYPLPVMVFGMQGKVLVAGYIVGYVLRMCLVGLFYIREHTMTINFSQDISCISSYVQSFWFMPFHVAIAAIIQTSMTKAWTDKISRPTARPNNHRLSGYFLNHHKRN